MYTINSKIVRQYIAIILLAVAFINQNTLRAQTSTTVYTCKYTPVTAWILPEMSNAQMAYALSQVAQQHPNAQVLSGPTTSYNCHGYAYHLTEGYGNPVWINNDQISKYWNDCYQVTSNPATAVKIYYSGDHTAVASVSGKYDSKWGSYPLMRHDPHDVPMSYQPYSRTYYERQPPPVSVSISGPTDLYSGQTGNYTAVVSNNNGPINNYTWQILENYTNGQSSGWLPFHSGGNSPFRSLYMLGNFSSVVLRVTVTDNTNTANTTMYILNSSGNPLRVASVNLSAAPNPFSSSTVLSYALAKDATVQLEIYSADRRLLSVLSNGKQKAGQYEHRLNANSWASGTYFAELTVTDETNRPQRTSLTLNVTR